KKTDKLDAHGINRLQRVGTLPTVWIPDGALRDRRELFRTRMTFTRRRTSTKNRIHATLAKYGVRIEDTSDIFNNKGRVAIEKALSTLPDHTQFATQVLLSELNELEAKIEAFEERIIATYSETEEIKLLRTLPGIGPILGEVIASEIGDISRFTTAARLASYSGTTPSVHASGGKYRYGRAPADTNHYLKWAYAEAANTIMRVRRRLRYRHVADLYDRVRSRRGHSIAIGAVSRHLAEASWAVLTKKEPYREPVRKKEAVSSTSG
ncbi:MAG: IS110 family transposase, partial [Spirochaetaceae bacterium]